MHSQISETYAETLEGQEAKSILLRCVHCGFCNATCPTYQLSGEELDGPRGRIYLLKQLLEDNSVTHATQQYLDRCLHCCSCETTCPSGVKFGRLADIGQQLIERQGHRPWPQRILRQALLWILPYPQRVKPLLTMARLVHPLLPAKFKIKLPLLSPIPVWPPSRHTRRVLLLQGCVQNALAPHIDVLTAQVLDKIGISAIAIYSGCCGAINYHLNDHAEAKNHMRQLLHKCEPYIDNGAEAIIMTASGCVAMLKEYAHILRNDPDYADKAARFSTLTRDICEILRAADLSNLQPKIRKIAFQSPCSLQHAQQLNGVVEAILLQLGFELTSSNDAHLCCGSAGTYSLLQPQIAAQLRSNKLYHLQAEQPELIATANIGCLLHLQAQAEVPVQHWIELLAE